MKIKTGRFKGFRKTQGGAVGGAAKRTYECQACGSYTRMGKVSKCYECGSTAILSFDSFGEFKRWLELKLLLRGGEIADLKRQVRMPLYGHNGDTRTIVAHLVADFTYTDTATGEHIVEDFKGAITDIAILKIKWLEAQGQEVLITK